MLRHKSACIMSVLAVLMLSTACSTAGETTIIASPTDTVAAPEVTSGANGRLGIRRN